jgi:hypothetical protein
MSVRVAQMRDVAAAVDHIFFADAPAIPQREIVKLEFFQHAST